MRALTIVYAAGIVTATALAACSAQSDSNPPRNTAGSSSTTGGSAVVGGGGTGNVAGSNVIPQGGSTVVAGGATGFAGAAPQGGAAPTGGSAGAATGGATGGCMTTKVGTGAPNMIDDFEHAASGLIPANDGRIGGWWVSKSMTGTVTPMAGAAPVPVAGTGTDTTMILHLVGSDTDKTMGWGADASVAITATNGCYDAGVYTGVSVSLAGTGSVYVQVITAESKAAMAGPFRKEIPITAAWADYAIKWTDLAQGWGTMVPFNVKSIVALDIAPSAASAASFDISIDNLQFTK